jgi:MYXO-CTERM domain-containing protein
MTHKCIAGCRVLGGNSCPAGLICDGAGLVPGKCVVATDMATNIPDAHFEEPDLSVPDLEPTGFKLTGGGIGCAVGGNDAASLGSFLLIAFALVALRLRRRFSK